MKKNAYGQEIQSTMEEMELNVSPPMASASLSVLDWHRLLTCLYELMGIRNSPNVEAAQLLFEEIGFQLGGKRIVFK